MGLEIEDDNAGGEVMALPCGALRGKLCSIYPNRPRCCRTFECRLLNDVRRGAVSVDEAKGHIANTLRRTGRVRQLLVELGQRDMRMTLKERCAEAIALTEGADVQKRAELESEMSAVEALVQRRFLAQR